MFAIILAISLFSVSSDTIEIKSTQNISYRLFASDSNLYFQYKANKNWSELKIIDEKVSEYAMITTSGDYIHIAWCKDGRVYYKTNIYPVRNNLQGAEKMNSFKENKLSAKISNGASPITQNDTIQWECNISISPYFTEPASNLNIDTKDEYIYVTWQAPTENKSITDEIWRRARWIRNTPFEWEEPQNISPNIMPTFDIPHSSNNRDPIQMKRVTFLQSGLHSTPDGKIICCDSDHNGSSEITFATGTMYPSNPLRWEVWEHRPTNRYELVYADTGAFPPPPGITTGNFTPYDVGDIDRDSMIDLVGSNVDKPLNPDTIYYVVTTQESPNYLFYPESLSWHYRYSNNFLGWGQPYYFPDDLDNDNKYEILFAGPHPTANQIINYIFENISNNMNVLVFAETIGPPPWSYAYGDFDLDGKMEFVSNDLTTAGRVWIFENIGDNQYNLTWLDRVYLPNGSDVFSGNDLDGDGRPEFFVAFAQWVGGYTCDFFLYMWEATGNNTYERTLIDQKRISPVDYSTGRRSKCGDIDGDGIEEIVWATPVKLFVYKATGNNQFQQVWQWFQDHGTNEALIVNVFDMNNNGYKEIVVGGSGKTSIFEVEAVRLLRPNGGETFHIDSTEIIQWQTFHPPRCDSLSLFYSIDNGSNYTTITHGISGNDTSYLWTVPNVNSDSCKIKIIAYGPGWQYDESDGTFRITTAGIEERSTLNALRLTLKVTPNPASSFFVIHGLQTLNQVQGDKTTIKLFDVSGKLVKEITLLKPETKVSLNNISTGVYFLSLETEEKRIIERLIIIK